MSILELNNLAKRYSRKVWGVKQMDLAVEDKEFIVLLGPSGCGKTTCMRMIAGLEQVTRGSINLAGRDITDLAPKERNVSMVFQNYAIWPHMNVFDNIAFALRLKKIPAPEIKQRVEEVARMVKIFPLLKRLPGQMSGGQQQRVALARALAVRPQLFLMDEPLSNLDAKLRGAMRTELKAIHQGTGATSIFVTHDQSEAMSMADRIVIMKDGEIIQVGTPDEVYFHSADSFVAGFIGTPATNFFKMKIEIEKDIMYLRNKSFRFALPAHYRPSIKQYSKSEILVGIRPEDFLLSGSENSQLTEKVLVVEPQGSYQILAFESDENIVKVVDHSLTQVNPGDTVHLTVKGERVHLFDVDNEKRIPIKS